MRISDWSSDVCSSDLLLLGRDLRLFRRCIGVEAVNLFGEGNTRPPHDDAVEIAPMFNIDLVATVDVLGNELLVENMDVGLGRCPGTTSKSGGSCIEQQPDLRLRCGLEGLPALKDRKSVVEGKGVSVRVDHGGGRSIKKKK